MAISVFGATLGAAIQCILLTAACGVAQTLLGVFKPFAYREANLVSMQAFGCLVLSAQAALFLICWQQAVRVTVPLPTA